jgi:hypothetical protein
VRGLALEIAPLFGALLILNLMPRLGPVAFIAAALLILVHASLCIRDGAVLASRAGVQDFRRKNPFMFWSGMSVHFILAAFCFSLAGILLFRKT